MDHILEFGDKMNLDSLQEGFIPDTETLSRSNLPFAVHWIAALAGGGGGLPYKKGGDARWENLNEPLKGTNVGVA